MVLLVAIVLGVFVVPEPWNVAVVATGLAWEAGESLLWIRWSQRRRARVGAETLLGETARAVSPLAPQGHVRVRGELWRARSTRAETVQPGAEVQILALEGLILVVEPVSDPP